MRFYKIMIMICILCVASFAQWPYTYGNIQTGNADSGVSSMYNRSLVMDASGALYCVYRDNTSDISAKRIYISRSTDSGMSWDQDWIEVTDTGTYGRHSLIAGCSMAIDDNEDLHVVWHRYQYSPTHHSTYYRKITDIHGTTSMGLIVSIFNSSLKANDSGVAMDSEGYIWLLSGGPSSWKSQIWKSDSVYAAGGTFRLIGCPSSGSTQGVSMCIDSDDNVHVAYYDNSVSATYAMHRVYNGTAWETANGIGNGSTGGRDHNCGLCADDLGNVHLLYGDNIGDVSGTWYLRYRKWDTVGGMGDPTLIAEFPTSLYSGVINRYFSNICCNEMTGEVFALFRDLTMGGSMCLYNKTLSDTAFSLAEELTPDDSTSNYYYTPRMRGALYPSFNNTSILIDMSWEEDKYLSPHEAFHRYTLSDGPYLAYHFPSSGSWVSQDTVVCLNFLDLDGIDPSTAVISVNGVVYSISDPELSSSGDRIEFRPPMPWTDGTITVVLESVDDILGHSTPDTGLTFTFEVDKTPPTLAYREPDSGLIADYVPDGAMMIFGDVGCGADSMCWHISANGIGFDPPGGGGIILEGDSLVMLAFTLGGVTIPTDDTSWIGFTVWDKPDIGEPNEHTYYWWFIAATGIEETRLPGDFSLSAYPNPFNSAVRIGVESGELRVESGELRVESGGLRVESGELRVESVEIFDISGRLVAELSPRNCIRNSDPLNKGVFTDNDSPLNKGGCPEGTGGILTWQPGEHLGSGVYLVRATTGYCTIAKRIVYLK